MEKMSQEQVTAPLPASVAIFLFPRTSNTDSQPQDAEEMKVFSPNKYFGAESKSVA